ncbi:MAG: tetratricopeptide repeat protein [Bacteroidales bacterium]|nr:tetratricopeptide repeat protein [Bacteroidales bacterium]
MKKLHVFLALVCMSAMVFAQSRNLRNADTELRRERLDRALTAIKLAMEEPENQSNAMAWLSQAKIYTAIAVTEKPEYRKLEPNPIPLAFQSFQKVFSLNEDFSLLARQEISNLAIAAYNSGVALYQEQRFSEAVEMFKISINTNAFDGVIDTLGMFSIALSAYAAGDKAMAKEFYLKVIELEADQPSAYINLALIYIDENDFANAGRYADLVVERFSDDYMAMINAANIHLQIHNYERASQILSNMAEQYADDPVVFFALGAAYAQIKMPKEAEQAYLRTLELQSDYFEAIFNLGVLYYNQGVDIRLEADALPMSEQKKYEELLEKANDMFRKAAQMLEKALEVQPNDIDVMMILKGIYTNLGMMDKVSAINTEIEKQNR